MNVFLITFLIFFTVNIPIGIAGEDGTDPQKKTLVKDSIPQPELKKIFSEVNGNEVNLSWTVKDQGRIVLYRIEKIYGDEIELLQELKVQGDSKIPQDYTLTDLLSAEASELEAINYRVNGIDSSGNNVVQKQITVLLDEMFTGYVLEQNYPNPFNPATKIKYSIPAAGHVTLKVYNILGNQVETLVDEYKPPGAYESEFNGTGLTSGVYLYTIQAGEYTETRRMVLMK